MHVSVRALTAMAGGRPPRTSPRPPVLLHGAISAPTKTTFMPALAHTTSDGNLPPRRACCWCLGAARALVRMLSVSAAADARAPLRPCAAPRRNVDASGTPRPARVATSCDVARAAMPINPLRRRERKDVCTDRFRFEEPGSSNTQIRARIWTKLKDRIGSDRNGTEPGRRRDEQPCRAVRALVDGAVHFSPFTGWQ